ncbi:thermosome subunit [Candidatus Pacearchaeota archaeon ex4484_71]|nr:MAG: thermosome subunit [Candidatus Pacearchaeota archaeon ex4484_71]
MAKNPDLLPEDIQRIIGRDAQRNNILAAKMVSEIVKTTLGPKGMDKMLVSPSGEIIITNDGVTILDEMQIEHPAAKMMVEIARTQESEVGDGTTTSVMLAGKFLENAERLLDKKIHATTIAKGYRIAHDKAQEILKDLSLEISPENEEVLKQIAITAMTGKGAEDSKHIFSEMISKAVKLVSENGDVDLNDIKIEKLKGNSIADSELVQGVVLNKEKISQDMPKKIIEAKIALVDFPIEIKNPEIDTKISVTDPGQLQKFLKEEEYEIRSLVEKIVSSGANTLFCQKGVDDFAKYLLAKEGIYTCRRVSRSDLEKISKATGGKIISNIDEVNSYDLGDAEIVEEVKNKDDYYTYIRGCKNPKSVTILIRGGTDHVIDEIGRAFMDGLGDVASVVRTKLVVPGGGAIEIELSKRLREFAQSLDGREQLAVVEYANALEFIPSTLAENGGLDPIDILTQLKAEHEKGEKNTGLNLFSGKIENVLGEKIIEPYKVKSQALSSASEVAIMILRIDDVIASKPNKEGNMEKYEFGNGFDTRSLR